LVLWRVIFRLQTPLKQSRIAHRYENSGAAKCARGSDEGDDISVSLAHGMREGQIRNVNCDPSLMLYDPRGSLCDCIEHFAATVMAVDERADAIAGLHISGQARYGNVMTT